MADTRPRRIGPSSPSPKLTWPQAARWRVRRQHLDRREPPGSMLAVASRLCGLHAQVMSSAEFTVWARVENLGRREVERALWEDRTLLKVWGMRGTLHLLPASEFSLWSAALRTSPRYLRATAWQNYFGVSLDELDRLTDAIGAALQGRVLSREELAKEVGRITGSPAFGAKLAEGSWGTILKPAAFKGWLCFAPSLGQRVRFTHPGTWLSLKDEAQDSHAAAATVTRRFLSAYAPATAHDLARWWGGGGIATARQWMDALSGEICRVDVEGTQAWMLAADVREARELPPVKSVRLLPGFDQYVIGASHHAAHLLPGDLRGRVYRPQGWISPVLLVNGRMDGVWRHQVKGSRVEVTIDPFIPVPAWVRRQAGHEAERFAEFLGLRLNLEWAV